MPAFRECRVLLIFTLILAKNETAAAGFKASESLCLPQVDSKLFHSTAPLSLKLSLRKLMRGSGTVSLPADPLSK